MTAEKLKEVLGDWLDNWELEHKTDPENFPNDFSIENWLTILTEQKENLE